MCLTILGLVGMDCLFSPKAVLHTNGERGENERLDLSKGYEREHTSSNNCLQESFGKYHWK